MNEKLNRRKPDVGNVRRWVALVAVVALAICASLVLVTTDPKPPDRADAAASDADRIGVGDPAAIVNTHSRPMVVLRTRDREAIPARDQAEERPQLDARDYIAELRATGETEGLAAFPLPGTNPPKSGIIVPDDYELPEGYARHYQTTDDGQRLDPILALSPGYDLVDEHGKPFTLGHDRIVPPELAPPDLPRRILEIPSPSNRDTGQH